MCKKIFLAICLLLSISSQIFAQASMPGVVDTLQTIDTLSNGSNSVVLKKYTHHVPITADSVFGKKDIYVEYKGAEIAELMRSNGKIYVVVAVLATIFAGIFAYLIYLDRKITKAESKIK